MYKLNDHVRVGNIELDGRIVMPPMGTYQCDENGFVTEQLIDYYRQRAKNPHVSLIETEHCYVDLRGKTKNRQMSIAEDDKIEGLHQLVEAIHEEGKRVFVQLNFGGAASPRAVCQDEPLAPSQLITCITADTQPPKEMTKENIQWLIQKYADAALRAKKAGFDGIEVHSAHGYLLNQFYSPITNQRKDEYGGSLANRLRLHCDIIRAARNVVGENYPISVRLGGYDDMEDGNTLADAVEAARILSQQGIQLLSVTGGLCRYMRQGHTEPGYFGDMSRAIRKVVNIPVLLTGGVRTLDEAEVLLENRAAELIGVGRPLLSNAKWMIR